MNIFGLKKGSAGKNGLSDNAAHPLEMASTPAGSTRMSGRSPGTSRPSSLFPKVDFRNAPREEILDIKSDVMVSWLHQEQMERLWISGMPGEGIVLKKSRGSYTCSPEYLSREIGGLYEQVSAMNVRVRFLNSSKSNALISCVLVCNDRQY